MTDFSKILDKAKELENKMKESQEKIKNIQVEGTSGVNSVKVKINGDGEMIKIEISEDTMKEKKTIIEDLIVAAHNNAKVQLNPGIGYGTGGNGHMRMNLGTPRPLIKQAIDNLADALSNV